MIPPVPLEIRPENANLVGPIRDLLCAAFPTADEARVVDDLRAADALSVSLVAVESGRVVGHIAFSPVSILPPSPKPCLICALAPLSVAPDVR